jgi:hypothetical protein
MKRRRDFTYSVFIAATFILLTIPYQEVLAIPVFSRTYNTPCNTCHVVPSLLNRGGQEFVARRYQFSDASMMRTSTIPVAAWVSYLGQRQPTRDDMRGFPNRIELIASDAISSKLSYFVEWRALSLELRGDGTLRDRSGRFEDLFVIAEVAENFSATVGQFRMLSQVDVSQRLSISEPAVFSTGLRGERASTGRLTGLRSFSPSGRSPAVRVQYQRMLGESRRQSDGWFAVLNVPMSGEFSLPLTKEARTEASFELEAVPKGLFVETYLRRGLSSVGIHVFTGSNDRFLAQLVGTTNHADLYLSAALGVAGAQQTRMSTLMAEALYAPVDWGAVAVRAEHLTGIRRKPSITPYAAVHLPGTSYTVRIAVEQRIQKNNHQTSIETSLIF